MVGRFWAIGIIRISDGGRHGFSFRLGLRLQVTLEGGFRRLGLGGLGFGAHGRYVLRDLSTQSIVN